MVFILKTLKTIVLFIASSEVNTSDFFNLCSSRVMPFSEYIPVSFTRTCWAVPHLELSGFKTGAWVQKMLPPPSLPYKKREKINLN